MREQMPAHVWDGWLRYAKVEPFGEERDDLRAGIIASVVANAMGRKKGQKAFSPKDFIPRFEPPRPPSVDEVLAKMIAMNAALGGTLIDNRIH